MNKQQELENISNVFRMEEYLKEQQGSDIEWLHRFVPGMYSREMFVPAGNLLTGAVHKQEHISIFLEGVLLVPDEDGNSKVIQAPMVEVGHPGMKRIGVALTDVRWITVHRTDAQTVQEVEDEIITNDPNEVYDLLMQDPTARIEYEKDKALGQRDQVALDQADFKLIEDKEPREELLKLPVKEMEHEGVEIKQSERHGLGLFTTKDFRQGEVIAPGVVDGELISFSRYCNHSRNPNAEPLYDGSDAYIRASRDIETGEEVTMDYRDTIK